MKKIIFIRTAEYTYRQSGNSLYQSLDAIGLQVVQPRILKPSLETTVRVNSLLAKYKPTKVFCSQFLRSRQTARLFSRTITVAPQLNEIKFSMDDFSTYQELSKNEFDTEKINEIRYRFSCALLEDSLQEKQKSIIERMTAFISMLHASQLNTTILCCSHGFIMKLYENFFRSGLKANHFEDIVRNYDWRKPPFEFLDGFVAEFSNGNVKISKISKCSS